MKLPNCCVLVAKKDALELVNLLGENENYLSRLGCDNFLSKRGTSPTEEYWK